MPLVRKDPPGAAAPHETAPEAIASLRLGPVSERWAAARGIGLSPADVAILGQALASEAEPRVRGAIFTRLAQARSAESVAAVLSHLRSDDPGLRTGALDALRAMPQAVLPTLSALLADEDADVRLLACEIARGLASGEATRLLCALIERETEANVCGAAIEVLAEVGALDALPSLARCAERFAQEPFIAFSIKAAGERIVSQSDERRG